MITWIAAMSCVLAVVPCALFLLNLRLYAPLPQPDGSRAGCSVLIPARNEEQNISAAVRSILGRAVVKNDDFDIGPFAFQN